MFQAKVLEKIKIHILCSTVFHKIVPFMRSGGKNIVEPDRPQVTIWRMRIAWLITTATNTQSEYVKCIAFHCNNGCTNAPQCYVTSTLLVTLDDSALKFGTQRKLFRQSMSVWEGSSRSRLSMTPFTLLAEDSQHTQP